MYGEGIECGDLRIMLCPCILHDVFLCTMYMLYGMYVCCTMCAMYNVHVYLCEAAGEGAINFYASCVYQLLWRWR